MKTLILAKAIKRLNTNGLKPKDGRLEAVFFKPRLFYKVLFFFYFYLISG